MKVYDKYRTAFDAAGPGNLTAAPVHVDIELAKKCNLACIMCPYGSPEWISEATQGMMATDMALALVDEMKVIGVLAMKPNFRGEPLLHRDLERILHAAQGMTDIRINTNLIGLTMPRAYALRNLCDLIIVSMDGASRETYEAIRAGATWDRFTDNLRMLASVPGKAVIQTQMVVQRDNAHETVEFLQFAADLGIEAVTKDVMDRGQDGALLLGNRRAVGRRLCQQPFQRIVVGYDGVTYGCCSNWSDEYPTGRYPDESLLEIWQNTRTRELRRMAEHPESGFPCRGCTVGTSYEWEQT